MDSQPLASRSETSGASGTSISRSRDDFELQWDQTYLRINYIVQNLGRPPPVNSKDGGGAGMMSSAKPGHDERGGSQATPAGETAEVGLARGVGGETANIGSRPPSGKAVTPWPQLTREQAALKMARISTWRDEVAEQGDAAFCACSDAVAASLAAEDAAPPRKALSPLTVPSALGTMRGLLSPGSLPPLRLSPIDAMAANTATGVATATAAATVATSSVHSSSGLVSPAPTTAGTPAALGTVTTTAVTGTCSVCSRLASPAPITPSDMLGASSKSSGTGGAAAKKAFQRIGDLMRLRKKQREAGDLSGNNSNSNSNTNQNSGVNKNKNNNDIREAAAAHRNGMLTPTTAETNTTAMYRADATAKQLRKWRAGGGTTTTNINTNIMTNGNIYSNTCDTNVNMRGGTDLYAASASESIDLEDLYDPDDEDDDISNSADVPGAGEGRGLLDAQARLRRAQKLLEKSSSRSLGRGQQGAKANPKNPIGSPTRPAVAFRGLGDKGR